MAWSKTGADVEKVLSLKGKNVYKTNENCPNFEV